MPVARITDAARAYIEALHETARAPEERRAVRVLREHIDSSGFSPPARLPEREIVWRFLNDEVGRIDERIEQAKTERERERLRQAMRGLSTIARKTLQRGDTVRRNAEVAMLFAIVMHAKSKKPMLAFCDGYDVILRDQHMNEVASGYYDFGQSPFHSAPQKSGYPRVHTPHAMEQEVIGRGFGAALYNSLAAGARARFMFGGDMPDMSKVGSGVCSSSSSRTEEASEFWDKALLRGFSFRTEINVTVNLGGANDPPTLFAETIQPRKYGSEAIFAEARAVLEELDESDRVLIDPLDNTIGEPLVRAIIDYLEGNYELDVTALEPFTIRARRDKRGDLTVLPIEIKCLGRIRGVERQATIPVDVLPYLPTKGATGAGQMVLCNFEPTYVSTRDMAVLPGTDGFVWVEEDFISDFNADVLRLLDLSDTPESVLSLIYAIVEAVGAQDALDDNPTLPRAGDRAHKSHRRNGLTPEQQAAAQRVHLDAWADLDD